MSFTQNDQDKYPGQVFRNCMLRLDEAERQRVVDQYDLSSIQPPDAELKLKIPSIHEAITELVTWIFGEPFRATQPPMTTVTETALLTAGEDPAEISAWEIVRGEYLHLDAEGIRLIRRYLLGF